LNGSSMLTEFCHWPNGFDAPKRREGLTMLG
jgi:hypothetical protein